MIFTSLPDSAIFDVNGHHISSELKVDAYGCIVLPLTGEKLSEIMKRVDDVTFYRDGKPLELSYEDERLFL